MTAIEAATARYARAMEELTSAGLALEQLTHSSPLAVRTVQQLVAAHFGIRVEDLWSDLRPARISVPRGVAMYFLRVRQQLLATEIAVYFRKDHSSVPAAVHAIQNRIDTEPKFRREVQQLFATLSDALAVAGN